MSENVKNIGADEWQSEVIESDTPVVVDFWAPWCGPCRAIAPVLEEIATESEGTLKIVKVNVDENKELAVQFQVMNIPQLLLFKGGEMVERVVGAKGKQAYLDTFTPHLG